MSSLETLSATGEISSNLDKLLKDISSELSPDELKNTVSLIKSNFKGKFDDQEENNLYSCLRLFADQGLVSDNKLTLLEILTPKKSKRERIHDKIRQFKSSRQRETKTKEELTGRAYDLEKVMAKLTTGSSSVVNLYGTSGVGKTTLAKETVSKWPGKKFKVDFRGINDMKSVHFHVLNVLMGSKQTVLAYEANPVIARIEQLKLDSQSDILLLLDNVDQFARGGDEEGATDLNGKFVTFLRRLLGPKTDGGESKLKILLTSRTLLCNGDNSLSVDNYEVKALDNAFSSAILQTLGNCSLEEDQRETLVQMCHGNPLILSGMAAILRQNITDDKQLLETLEQEIVTEPSETGLPPGEKVTPITHEREIFDHQKEGIGKEQENCLRKMFFFLPSKRLKESAVSVSLFCRSFSAEAAATILGVNHTEAVIQLEGLRNSKVVSVDPEANVLSYDIHPLMRKFLRSIGNSKTFITVYQKARDRFSEFFLSQMKDLSALLDKDYIKAYNRFDLNKPNFELALNISLKSDHLLIPEEHHEMIMICYLFEAMLDEKQKRSILNSWAEKAEDDGKEGSLLQAELKCQEAWQVLRLEGWKRASEVLKEADETLKRVQKESNHSQVFRLTRSSYLFVQGEMYTRAGNLAKALTVLHESLETMQDILQTHTSITRCLNAIGNCHNRLIEPDEALKYYTRAYEMRKELSGSMNHFDMPLFKGQIGTVYEEKGRTCWKAGQHDEARKQFRKAIECYQEALVLAKELKIPGMLNTALFNRNIANAHAWMKEFREAYQPAKNGYEIRKDMLGNHPWTARSAFQMAEICRRLNDCDEARKFYKEAWEIEKSLSQGNHSEVMVRIVQSFEEMLEGVRKAEFQKETLEFYQRYWNEQRHFEVFEFSSTNEQVINSIVKRLSNSGDRQTQEKYEREALLFYEGAWNSPDTKKLPDSHREAILQNLLKFCNMLHENHLSKKYQVEALKFYEKLWKKNKVEMKQQDRIRSLTTLESYASSVEDTKRVEKYGTLLKEAKQSGSLDSSISSLPTSGSAAEQLSTEDNDDSDKDIGDHDDDCDIDDGDCTNGDREITKKQVSNIASEKQELEQPENPKEQEPDKKMIREDRVPCEGDTWSLPEAAALVTFCPGAITKPLLISCSILNPRSLSPPLGSNEVLVSNVIELSHGGPPDLEFSGDRQGSVTVALMHSASNFRGYEVVIKHLVDPENNEWVDLVTSNFWNTSAKSTVPNWLFPFAEAVCTITPYSSFAAIWRLKTFLFLKPKPVTPEFTCTVPDYPDVSVSIPWNSVPAIEDFCLTLKVQELPSIDRNEQGMLVGPVLHISSSYNVELLEPAKITIPLTFFKGRGNLENLLSGTWKIFHFSREKSEEWTESTDQLVMPPVLANGIVTFQVKHFCRIWLWWLEIKKSFGCLRKLPSDIYQRAMGQQAGFLACLCDDVTRTNYVLTLSCFPIHLRDQVNRRISETYLVNFQGEGSSEEPLCTKDQAHVTFSEAFSLQQSGKTEDLYLRFLGNAPFQKSWPVSVRDPGNLQVDFFKSQYRQERRRSLCTLYIIPRSPVQASPMEFPRVSVSDEVPLDSPADLVQRNESSVKRSIESPCTSPKRAKLEESSVKRRIESPCTSPKRREDAVKDGAPEKDDLEGLAVEIVAEWKEVGRRLLNNNEAELYAIDHENKKLSEKAYKMLLKWTAAKGSEATYQDLHDALCHRLVNRRDLAEKYCLVNHD